MFENKETLSKNMRIQILRTSNNTNSITGELYVDGKFICYTLELPYKENKNAISSIPESNYGAIIRYDKSDKWRIQLTETGLRSGIQIHIGNYPREIQGCILVGCEVKPETNEIFKSQLAYSKLKEAFYGTATPTSTPNRNITVEIKQQLSQSPNNKMGS